MTGNPKYATRFETKVFGVRSDVDVVVDLENLTAETTIAMRRLLSSHPAFSIALDDLKRLRDGVQAMRRNTSLLEALLKGAESHQLNCVAGGATAVVTRLEAKPARLTLSIGLWHWEGDFAEFDAAQLDRAITELDGLVQQTVEKIKAGRRSDAAA
jgi:hypothetical protein